MKITIITPSAGGTRTGNWHTAQRYAAFLRGAGHAVRTASRWDGAACDLMIALHARKSHDSIARFRRRFPDRPLVVVLTGTDLYRDLPADVSARASLELATLLVTLQDQAERELAPRLRQKVRVVYQSARTEARTGRSTRRFRICVLGHLREEKDPFRAALALAHLRGDGAVEVVQIGQALTPEMAATARRLMDREPRYRWIGGVAHSRALGWLASSQLLVVSSRMEGGANVVCEAVRTGVPVAASRIPGNVGMLGTDYAGYFALGDERALARLIDRARLDRAFYRRLQTSIGRRRHLFAPDAERRSLLRVVREAERLVASTRRGKPRCA